ncbi:MAG: glycosyltransferase family 8 protein [Puniceicoccales bacterium]|jgi:UDP-glucose:(glucosyl)LPS alpha-1,3-glucosyltransferase/UDP-glucose:(galactosyl)LPS alpha-1,2-glucosyltransferase|nr:glycosyltransferase family 8 protein [Puniceicoccales bacterium]
MESTIHIAFACNDTYVQFTAVALWSLMEHYHGTAPVHVHILSGKLSATSRQKLQQLQENFSALQLHFPPLPKVIWELPVTEKYPHHEVYARIFLAEILPQASRVLYLDSDTLVLGEWESLYHLGIKPHAFAARSEKGFAPVKAHNRRLRRHKSADYFNVGVLLIDLNRWRDKGITASLIRLIQARGPFDFPEQDALNIIIDGNYYPLAPDWNKFDYRNFYPGREEEPKIVHFIYQKPWKSFSEALEIKCFNGQGPLQLPRRFGCYYLTHLFWETCARTPFAEDLKRLQDTAQQIKPMKCQSILHRLSFIERFLRRALRNPIKRLFSSQKS